MLIDGEREGANRERAQRARTVRAMDFDGKVVMALRAVYPANAAIRLRSEEEVATREANRNKSRRPPSLEDRRGWFAKLREWLRSAQAAQARHQRARNSPILPGRSESVVRVFLKSRAGAQGGIDVPPAWRR
jgi:hypothetical protein